MRYARLSLLALLAAMPASAALKQGDPRRCSRRRHRWPERNSRSHSRMPSRKGPVVVYFYPSAYTGGCNVQAHEFAVNYDKFTAAGASVVGVSLDNIARLNEFSADPEYCAGKLPVASDETGEIAKSYDLKVITEYNGQSFLTMKDTRGQEIGHAAAERTTFVVMPDGKIANTIGGVSPKENVMKALEAVQQLAKD